MPTAFSSVASAAAKRVASFGSPLRPSVAIGGHSVNGARSRATRPPSWSTLTQSGNSARELLGVVGQLGDLLGRFDVAREQDDPAKLKLARERTQLGRNGLSLAGCRSAAGRCRGELQKAHHIIEP